MTSTASKKHQQQTLTEFFAAKKSSRLTATKQASQALEKLKSLHADLEEIKAKKANLKQDRDGEKSPSYQRYANLLEPKLDLSQSKSSDEEVHEQAETAASSAGSVPAPKTPLAGKNALSRLETKRAALKAAREKLRQIEADRQTLKEFQATNKPIELVGGSKSSVEVPAYEKYHYLTVPSGTLPLPAHYEKLFEGFCAADTVVSMLRNRKELCRMDKLSLAVRKMTRHNFGLVEMSKILTLKPDAYRVSVEQHRFIDTERKLHHIVDFVEKPQGPRFLTERKADFKDRLVLRVAQYHQEFVDRVLPGSTIPMDALKRWHPKFRLHETPDIPEAYELPKIESSSEPPKATDILAKVRGRFSARIEKALETLAEKQQQQQQQQQQKARQAHDDDANTGAPKSKLKLADETSVQGVSKSLLERIKQKEALKMAERMVMGGDDAKERRYLLALPNLVRTIRQVFLSSPKAALLYTELTAKLNDSGSYDDLDSLLTRLSEIAPEWYKPLKVRNAQYVKIDKERDINTICARIENLAKDDAGSGKSL